jgi:hypothetical protein
MQAVWSRTPGDPPIAVTFVHSSSNAVATEEPNPTTG